MSEWKEIPETEGRYKINRHGEVLNVKKNKVLKNTLLQVGYYAICFRINGKKVHKRIHRLLAELFIPNPLNLPSVHHINHDRADYRLENLMWVTLSENKIFDYIDGTQKKVYGADHWRHKKIVRMDMQGNVIDIIPGLCEAARIVDGDPSHIMKACKGKIKYHKGFRWAYAEVA